MGKGIKGDLLGFNFNRVHSSNLGIVRIIPSNRINDNAPTHSDVVVDVPGATGSYYYGTIITKKDIQVHYAFDNVSETQLLKIKTLFSDKLPHKLVFDEEPDVYYMARVSNSAQLKHLCFLENGERVYKGEGSITFTCDYPYKIRQRTFSYVENDEDDESEKSDRFFYDFEFDYDFSGIISIDCAEERSLQIKIRNANENSFFTYNFILSSKTCIDFRKRIIYNENGMLSLKKDGEIDLFNLNLIPGEWKFNIFDTTKDGTFPILNITFDFYETIKF